MEIWARQQIHRLADLDKAQGRVLYKIFAAVGGSPHGNSLLDRCKIKVSGRIGCLTE